MSERYPRLHSPRRRYRRRGNLQDTVILELRVPAAMIPWLEYFQDWYGPSVEKTAVFLLTSELMDLQKTQWAGQYGGRPAAEAIRANVRRFLAEPVNCGPGSSSARQFARQVSEIHGDGGVDQRGSEL